MTKIITYQQPEQSGQYTIGGKAKNLFRLTEFAFQVPPFVVIPHETLRELLAGKAHDTVQIKNIAIPEELIGAILSALPKTTYFAVRSSGIVEDGEERSYAGQYETFLYVTKDQLARKIKEVWSSAFSQRVQQYSQADQSASGIAIIVQQMLNPDASGVAFGINPVTGNRKQHVISAVYGLGEGLVSGELDADTYVIDETGIDQKIANKPFRLVQHPEGGTRKTDVASHLQQQAVLSERNIRRISESLHLLYQQTGKYPDIEFAFVKDQLYLLQTRPVTGVSSIPDQAGQYLVWDNSNIIESYPGHTSPLTFSFITRMYERVYIQLLRLFGVSRYDIHGHEHVFRNMLGLIKGRVYYNLYSWYKVLSLLPGYSINAAFMEKMMGVKEKFELQDTVPRSRITDYLRVVYMIFNLVLNLVTLGRQTRRFRKHFNKVMKSYNAIDYDRKNAPELMALYRQYEDSLLRKWKAPLVNDFFAMIFFGSVHKMADKYHINQEGEIHNDLFGGSKDIISHEPAKKIQSIVHLIRENEAYQSLFQQYNENTIWVKLNEPDYKELKQAIDHYLEQFGDRYVGELKLETKTYKVQPQAFVKLIQSYVQQENDFQPPVGESTLRRDAERRVNKVLRWKPLKRIVFYATLKKARTLVSNRENLRYNRTLAFGIVREIFNALGKRFYAEGIIKKQEAIFYLSIQEIFDFIEGKSLSSNLQEIAELRENTYWDYQHDDIPDERFITHGMVYQGNTFRAIQKTSNTDGNIKGIGCCAGIVKGRVRLVEDPAETGSLNGDILVTSSTDPGWVTLFPSASGILVERGSLLSHSAIVSREMGIPCIVGITGVMQKLKTGDQIEMNGSTGVVQKIESYENE